MSAPAAIDEHSSYPARLFALVRLSLSQLVRPPSPARRAEAARRLARHSLLAIVVVGGVIVVLMAGFDAREIGMMPPRGTPGLWPVRVLTDFGKDSYVLSLLATMLVVVALVATSLRGTSQARLLRFGLRLQFLFFAVAIPLLPGELFKWIVGRGRPFVGGQPNPYNFAHFAGPKRMQASRRRMRLRLLLWLSR